MLKHEVNRYIINGLFATAVNYGVLNFNILILDIASYGIASFIAAIFGIMVSFIGSRYFVYQGHTTSLGSQIVRFGLLYLFIALLYGFVLYLWTDINGFNYNLGFLLATVLQVLLSYFGNKVLVFKNES